MDARNSTFNAVAGHQTNYYNKTYYIIINCNAPSIIIAMLLFWFVYSVYVLIFATSFPNGMLTNSLEPVAVESFQLNQKITYHNLVSVPYIFVLMECICVFVYEKICFLSASKPVIPRKLNFEVLCRGSGPFERHSILVVYKPAVAA